MTQVVINRCPRDSLLSDAGKAELMRRKSLTVAPDWAALDRSDSDLVAMVKEDANKRIWTGACSKVFIVNVPDGKTWKLNNNGNYEWISSPGGTGG